jgi:hypothetical protein
MYLPFSRAALTRKTRELSISANRIGLEGCQIKRLVKVCSEISGGYVRRYSATRLLSARVNGRISGMGLFYEYRKGINNLKTACP